MIEQPCVKILTPEFLEASEKLAEDLKLPICNSDRSADLALAYTENGLALFPPKNLFKKPLLIDFLAKNLQYRAQHLQHELLIKAAGLIKNPHKKILDATAGLGRESFLMSSAGASVVMLERNKIIHALLADALARLNKAKNLQLSLQFGDAKHYLSTRFLNYDLIYLDPMFVPKSKTAKVKKEMQILQLFIGPDYDAENLLTAALKQPGTLIIIKRPRELAQVLLPNHSFKAKDIRYDCYLT